MIREILREIRILKEVTDIDKLEFQYFYIDDIKKIDTITDMDDLGDTTYLEIVLVTEHTYVDGKYEYTDTVKIKTEDIINYIEVNYNDSYVEGEYLGFTESFKLTDVVARYIESKFTNKYIAKWSDFASTVGLIVNKINPEN